MVLGGLFVATICIPKTFQVCSIELLSRELASQSILSIPTPFWLGRDEDYCTTAAYGRPGWQNLLQIYLGSKSAIFTEIVVEVSTGVYRSS